MQFIWERRLLFLTFFLRLDVLPLAHPEQHPAPRHGLVLDASLMNGRRMSLADATADPAALLELYIPGLRRFAQALLRGDRERADDLVQDTLERALSSWRLRRVEGELRGWLYTILYNRFLSDQERRKRRSAYDTLTELLEDELPGVEGGQHSALEYRDFLRAFATLPAEQRSVLLLIGVEDLSYEEAARVLGVPIGTVMSRLSRGRERLRRLTGNQAHEDVRHRGADAFSKVI
jgi:RNA polymerase sigma-70 factor (ECF subfamily)